MAKEIAKERLFIMNKIPKSYQSSTPYYQLFFYSAFLALLLAAFAPMAQASPCSHFLGCCNEHGRLKNEIIGSNNIEKDLKKIPRLKAEPIFDLLPGNVLSVAGEISVEQIEDSMSAMVTLSLTDLMLIKNMRFVASSFHKTNGGVIYCLVHDDVVILYQPQTMLLTVQARGWPLPKLLRLNTPNESAATNKDALHSKKVGATFLIDNDFH